jgi:hypothetical protein
MQLPRVKRAGLLASLPAFPLGTVAAAAQPQARQGTPPPNPARARARPPACGDAAAPGRSDADSFDGPAGCASTAGASAACCAPSSTRTCAGGGIGLAFGGQALAAVRRVAVQRPSRRLASRQQPFRTRAIAWAAFLQPGGKAVSITASHHSLCRSSQDLSRSSAARHALPASHPMQPAVAALSS